MPEIIDRPPSVLRAEIIRLERALDAVIPAKAEDNLLIATWNVRSFASLTRKWTSTTKDSPKRDLRGLRTIVEIISRFDVVALQEVKGNLRALRDTLKFLGGCWGFLMTDVTRGDDGNDERLAFLFDRTRVSPSGLAAELVIPLERLSPTGEDSLRQQFARTPYAVSFRRERVTFILVTLHILYGKRESERIPELRGLAQWFREWARQSHRYHHNLIALGDFNIDRKGSALYEAFTSTGLTIPQCLERLPRTIFDDPDDPSDDNYYDQIAWFTSGKKALIDLSLRTGGSFDFMPHVYRGVGLTRNSISWRISDHYPLWVEFGLT